jgi:MFS family permease
MSGARERPRLPPTVVVLGLVSLFTDVASEMIYPLLPAFLAGLGAGGAFIGLVDGVADTVSALLKLASGFIADRVPRRKPLVVAGYGLAALVRPLVALAQAPWQVLAIRATDRVGKGLRGTPRDALIAQATPAAQRGAAFGFHRAMDHTGAFLGPLLAFAALHLAGMGERTVFTLASLPGLVGVVLLVVAVRDPAPAPAPARPAAVADAPAERLPARFYAYVGCLAIFTLGNSSDFFLLLRATDCGIPAAQAPLLWAALHAVKSTLSTPLSGLSDRLGRKRVIFVGWAVYAAAYLGFAVARTPLHVWALFGLYGVFFALTEGTEKALVADLAPPALRGRAYGIYNFVVGVLVLPASLGFGLVWDAWGHGAAFVAGASLAGAAALALALVPTGSSR